MVNNMGCHGGLGRSGNGANSLAPINIKSYQLDSSELDTVTIQGTERQKDWVKSIIAAPLDRYNQDDDIIDRANRFNKDLANGGIERIKKDKISIQGYSADHKKILNALNESRGDKSIEKALSQGYADFIRANNEAGTIIENRDVFTSKGGLNLSKIKKDMISVKNNGIAEKKGFTMREVARDMIYSAANKLYAKGFKRGKDWKTP